MSTLSRVQEPLLDKLDPRPGEAPLASASRTAAAGLRLLRDSDRRVCQLHPWTGGRTSFLQLFLPQWLWHG